MDVIFFSQKLNWLKVEPKERAREGERENKKGYKSVENLSLYTLKNVFPYPEGEKSKHPLSER